YRHNPYHVSTQTITELVPDKKVVWKISKSHLNFVEKGDEWDGTEVIFEIAKKGSKTELLVTHSGLVPDFQCFKDCSAGWNYYLRESLKPFIETGEGQPDPKSKAAA
ncbi:MAG: SRPBCC domain-containing protein, partial [Aestuariivirga sp.]